MRAWRMLLGGEEDEKEDDNFGHTWIACVQGLKN